MSGRAAKLVRRWKPVPPLNVLEALKQSSRSYRSAAKREFKKMNAREKGALRASVYGRHA